MAIPETIQKKLDQLYVKNDDVRALAEDIRDDMDIDDLQFPERPDVEDMVEEVCGNIYTNDTLIEDYITND
tara:strand:+ start:1268 stop:1480 length:213 start_codon:yes stop_codon:yes gene_type:complete